MFKLSAFRMTQALIMKGLKMAGTRTAPDVTGTATSKHVGVHWIDVSGDVWSESHILPIAATNAQIEAYLDSLQAASGASIYKVEVSNMFGTDALADSGNALDHDLKSSSVFDKLGVTLKHTTDPEKKNKIVTVPAPIAPLFVRQPDDGTAPDTVPYEFISDSIDGGSAELAAVLVAALAMFGAGWTIAWARYVEKVEINQKVRI